MNGLVNRLTPGPSLSLLDIDSSLKHGVLCERHRPKIRQEQVCIQPQAKAVKARHGRAHGHNLNIASVLACHKFAQQHLQGSTPATL